MNTLTTLSLPYQLDINPEDYEVWVIDNGSQHPLRSEDVEAFGPQFHYHYFEKVSDSPTNALNHFLDKVNTEYVMCMIDGAHMLTPRILTYAKKLIKIHSNPFIYTLNFHLGPYRQNDSMKLGYNRDREKELLQSIDWRRDGYSLFSISNYDTFEYTYASNLIESNCFVCKTADILKLGGFNIAFQSPGGGLVNLDLFNKFVSNDAYDPIVLLGEATFHQFHGGVSTNIARVDHPILHYRREYLEIYGKSYAPTSYNKQYYGQIPELIKSKFEFNHQRQTYNFTLQLIRQKEFASALIMINNKIKDNPFDFSFYSLKAKVLSQLNQPDEAIKAIQELIQLNPTATPEYYKILIQIFIHHQRYDEAIDYSEKLLMIKPEELDGYAYLASSLRQIGKKEEIRPILEDGFVYLKQYPNKAGSLNLLVRECLANDILDLADSYTKFGIEINPDSSKFHFLRARFLLKIGEYQPALSAFQKSKLLGLNNKALVHQLIGDCFKQLKDIKSALLHYFKAEEHDTNNPKGLKNIDKKILKCKQQLERMRQESPYKSIIFSHIPKTGGMSLRRMLTNASIKSGLTASNIYAPSNLGIDSMKNLIQLSPTEIKVLQKSDIIILLDHSPFGKEIELGLESLQHPFRFTLIRHPYQRALSYYNFMVYVAGFENLKGVPITDLDASTLESLMKRQQNMQVNFICGKGFDHETTQDDYELALQHLKNEFHLVGIYEHYSEFLTILKSMLPDWLYTDFDEIHINRINYSLSYESLPKDIVSIIEKYNQWDMRLYEEVKINYKMLADEISAT